MIHKYGTTICSNGWDNVTRHPLLNIMIVCPNGNVFIGSIDTNREWKDAHYICNALVGYIETIGVDNIVQICTDNVSSMKSAADLLICHFSSLYFKGFIFHCLDLQLETPLVIFCCYETNLMLLNPTKIRFTTNFLMVERLFKLRLAIEQTVFDLDLTTFVNSLYGSHHQNSFTNVKAISTNVKRDKFFGYLYTWWK